MDGRLLRGNRGERQRLPPLSPERQTCRMSEDVRYTWAERDLPVLREALRRLDDGDQFPNLEQIRRAVGLSLEQMRTALHALGTADPPYITYSEYAASEAVAGHIDGVSERARRELGSWPSAEGLVDRLAN